MLRTGISRKLSLDSALTKISDSTRYNVMLGDYSEEIYNFAETMTDEEIKFLAERMTEADWDKLIALSEEFPTYKFFLMKALGAIGNTAGRGFMKGYKSTPGGSFSGNVVRGIGSAWEGMKKLNTGIGKKGGWASWGEKQYPMGRQKKGMFGGLFGGASQPQPQTSPPVGSDFKWQEE
jgi:hypothetical protein